MKTSFAVVVLLALFRVDAFTQCGVSNFTLTAIAAPTSVQLNWPEQVPCFFGNSTDYEIRYKVFGTLFMTTYTTVHCANAIVVPGLTTGGSYTFQIIATAHCGGGSVTQTVLSNVVHVITEPLSQPTGLGLSNVGTSSLDISFSGVTGNSYVNPSYLVLRRIGASPTGVPTDNQSYLVGDAIGDGAVAYVGTATSFSESGLNSNTAYYYNIYAFNTVYSSLENKTVTNYITNQAPLVGNKQTLADPPTVRNASSITTSSFTANWDAVSGVNSYYLDVSADNFNTFVISEKVVNGTSDNIAGLTPNTNYSYRLRSINSSGPGPFSSTRITTTFQVEPTAQATALSFSNISSNSMRGNFTPASGNPAGYIVLRKEGSSPTGSPVDGTTYNSINSTIGDGKVVYVGAGLTFDDANLLDSKIYFYDVIAYNGAGDAINYLTTAPLEGNHTTLANQPATQATELVFSNITVSSMDVNFTGAPGALGYLVLMRIGTSPTGTPTDGTAYTSLTSTIGDGNVVYIGSSPNFSLSGLASNTVYYFDVFTYNGNGAAINYFTTAPLSSGQTTFEIEPTTQPSSLAFSNITPTSMRGNFTPASGNPTGYIVLRKEGSSPTGIPVDGTTYNSTNSTIGDGKVVYVGVGLTFDDVNLLDSKVYYYDVIAYNGTGAATNYLTPSPLENSHTTLATEPTNQATALMFSNVMVSSMDLSFTASAGNPSGYIVLRKQGASPTGIPVDGIEYSPGSTLGDGEVVFSGGRTTCSNTNLNSNAVYYYRVIPYNGSGQAINYLTTAPLEGGHTTLADEPDEDVTAVNFSNITTTSLELNFTNTKSPSGFLVLRRQGEAPSATPADGLTYSASNTTLGDGKVVYVGPSNHFSDTNLDVGTRYYYKVYSYNGDAEATNYLISGSTTNMASSYTLPAATVIQVGQTGQSSIELKWQPVANATAYEIDVSKSNTFSPLLANYPQQALGTEINFYAQGLTAATVYYFRVRAHIGSLASSNSNVIGRSTNDPSGSSLNLQFASAPSAPLSFDAADLQNQKLQVSTSGGIGRVTTYVNHRNNSTIEYTRDEMTASNAHFSINIQPAWLNELGMQYYFETIDESGVASISLYKSNSGSDPYTLMRKIDDVIVPIEKFGKALKNYQIISQPYDLRGPDPDPRIADLFESAMSSKYNSKKWRFLKYKDGQNKDYNDGLSVLQMEQGQGYWFISASPVTLSLGAATTYDNSTSKPFALRLKKGWNQIGNPFPYNLSWSEVLQVNRNPATVGPLLVYNSENVSLEQNDLLKVFSGGFVKADEDVTLNFQTTLHEVPSGGRMTTSEGLTPEYNSRNWILPLCIKQGELVNTLPAIGMREDAVGGKDRYDLEVPPAFLRYADFNSKKEGYEYAFTRDIVAPSDEYTWNCSIEHNSAEPLSINWDNEKVRETDGQLLLYDLSNRILVDMSRTDSYVIPATNSAPFRISYNKTRTFDADKISFGQPYPNPFQSSITIPFDYSINGDYWARVTLTIFDSQGVKVYEVVSEYSGGLGLKQVEWHGQTDTGLQAKPGMYLYKLAATSSNGIATYQGKLVKN